ncbi:MAG TPA: bifunctional oligoribonuclease/PAP phosphatase NrnA [Bacilli bacterium]|nr:bifunctional oligoribonuclease/PAP phosphatase NrnA [Bacilli bacterium]
MEKEILKLIKKYKKIVIARHIGGDPDALGASFGLKAIIEENFHKKEVIVVGNSISKFKYFGIHEKVEDSFQKDTLLIALDVPDTRRIEGTSASNYEKIIKIDHHPLIEKYADIEYIDSHATSTSELIIKLAYNQRLKVSKKAAELLFTGIVADTNRFLLPTTTYKTFELVAKIIKENKINPDIIYERLYERPISEVKLEGYISQNMTVSKQGVGYIVITDDMLKEFKVDSASVGNMMNNYNYIKNLTIWVVFVEDKKMNVIRASARSSGPVINKLFEQYNGGGHKLACGAKLKSFDQIPEILERLDAISEEYNTESI